MKRKILPIFLCLFIALCAKAQTFNYSFTTDNADNQNYSYALHSTITIVGIKITNIYYDNGSTGSFAFALVIKYSNTVTGSNIPSGNFYTFQVDASSNTGQSSLSNGFSNIPIATGNGSLNIGNNPTYNGSASQLGYSVGNTYTDNTTLTRFGYFTMALTVGGPSLSSTKSTATGTILPITLNQFTAILQNGSVSLNWSTLTEANSKSFMVERSADNTNFTAIQQIAAYGNSNALLNYSATDPSPLQGISYYRLKEVDIDGRFYYSPIASVNNTTASNLVNIYPTINTTNIIHFSGNVSNQTLDVFSINGTRLFSSAITSNQLSLPVLPKGIYLLRVSSTGKSFQFKTSKYIQQ